jgi:integrase
LIESVVSEIVESTGGALQRYTINEYFKSWIRARELTNSPGTFTRYQGIVNTFLSFMGSRRNLSLASLRSDDVQRYRDELAAKVSTGTVNTHLKVIRVALGKAWKAKHLDSNPAEYVDNLQRTDKHERRAFTREELRKLLNNASADWRTMILVGLYTGFRLSDAATLTWANTQARKMDYFRLCLNWSTAKSKDLVLESTQLDELPREEAAKILDTLRVFPAEFFGGDFAKRRPGARAWDYSTITSLDEFKEMAAPAGVISAVDWATGFVALIHGREALMKISKGDAVEMYTLAFAIDFESDQREHLLAAVVATKGSAEWNGEVIHPK